MTAVEIYLEKARTKHRMLQRSAEELLPEARDFAVEVLAELSLALSMLEGQQPPRSARPEAAASTKIREELMIELMKEAASPASDDSTRHARGKTRSSVRERRSALGNLLNLVSGNKMRVEPD